MFFENVLFLYQQAATNVHEYSVLVFSGVCVDVIAWSEVSLSFMLPICKVVNCVITMATRLPEHLQYFLL